MAVLRLDRVTKGPAGTGHPTCRGEGRLAISAVAARSLPGLSAGRGG